MCLGIPGKIVSIDESDSSLKSGTVSFGGIKKQIVLVYVPEANVDDYVIVHAGFAISKIDEKEAEKVFKYLDEIY